MRVNFLRLVFNFLLRASHVVWWNQKPVCRLFKLILCFNIVIFIAWIESIEANPNSKSMSVMHPGHVNQTLVCLVFLRIVMRGITANHLFDGLYFGPVQYITLTIIAWHYLIFCISFVYKYMTGFVCIKQLWRRQKSQSRIYKQTLSLDKAFYIKLLFKLILRFLHESVSFRTLAFQTYTPAVARWFVKLVYAKVFYELLS